ncbi:olfactory receptor 5AP2-like [Alligator mississippiensis]|uniref:olfactory receptor 5AP2-like n=1 Tax=Alligator mississippiensis TaxID=8496 RepID=UPI0028772936|nr:olfactory receptor 5AP2-like [Alligator mississippiensis]
MVTEGNHTLQEFILLGLTENADIQATLFVVFLLIYLITLVGNLGIMALVRVSPQLHKPMYFFLSHFSLVDAFYSTTITPNMLVALFSDSKAISFAGCIVQCYIFVVLGLVECYLLAVMAYDRFVAICNPLLYVVIMSKRICIRLVLACYLIGFLSAGMYTGCIFGGSLCGSNIINHFYCDITPLLKLSCSCSYNNRMVVFALSSVGGAVTVMIILISYFYILSTILRMHTAQSRSKAFNTCGSHLSIVSLFYGTGFFMYLQPSSSHNGQDKVASVFYTVVTPMLNPLIYSLRNKEVKGALDKLVSRGITK